MTVLADWDNTFRPGWSAGAWLEFLAKQERVTHASVVEYRRHARSLAAHRLSYERFLEATARLYVDAVASIPVTDVDALARDFVKSDRSILYEFSAPLLHALTRLGGTVALISGAPEPVLRAYAEILPIAVVAGMDASGSALPTPGTAAFKTAAIARLGLDNGDVALAIGDSVSDAPLFERARIRVVVDNDHLATRYPNSFRLDPRTTHSCLLPWIRARW